MLDGRLRFAPDKMYYRASEQKGNLPFADVSKSVVLNVDAANFASFIGTETLNLNCEFICKQP